MPQEIIEDDPLDSHERTQTPGLPLHVFAAAAILLASTILGCDPFPLGVIAENRTNHELSFRVLLEVGWRTVPGTAGPGETTTVVQPNVLDEKGCTAGGLIALAEDGREVARHDEPLCGGDRWVIKDGSGVTPS